MNKSRKTDEMKQFEFENALQITALLKDWSIEIFVMFLLMCGILRGDVIGLLYILIVGLVLCMRRTQVKRCWTSFFVMFAFFVLIQYFLRIGLPVEGFYNGYADIIVPSYAATKTYEKVTGNITNSSSTLIQTFEATSLYFGNATNFTKIKPANDEQHKKDMVDASRALIRWLCIKMDDPIILIFDLIILSVMTAIHSMFRFIKQLRPDEKRQLLEIVL